MSDPRYVPSMMNFRSIINLLYKWDYEFASWLSMYLANAEGLMFDKGYFSFIKKKVSRYFGIDDDIDGASAGDDASDDEGGDIGKTVIYIAEIEENRKVYLQDNEITNYESVHSMESFGNIKKMMLFLGSIPTKIYKNMLCFNEEEFKMYISDMRFGTLIKPANVIINGHLS
jgi:hypothetical protein